MPFYDLKCSGCGEEFNAAAKISEREQKLIKCAKCGSSALEPIFNKVNIIQSRKSQEPGSCPNAHACGGCCNH